jgi:DNA-binding winged helix-turn-helix (wHTH) protein/tetratricopeptide (TPR) repeat protein
MKEFHPFLLDSVNQCLWHRGESAKDERMLLAPKAFALLRYLVEHPGRLVTHSEILDALWPDTYVQPEVLKNRILDVRHALGDDARAPHFIETLPRRGYRFIAAVTDRAPDPVLEPPKPPVKLVGRDQTLRTLHDRLAAAMRGERRILFLTGEPGIGKSALLDRFLAEVCTEEPSIRSAHGQCVEGYGGKEAYYPVLEMLWQLCRGPRGESIVPILAEHAPTSLIQFPSLLRRGHRDTLQREILGATRERMLRELAEAIEVITEAGPLVLVFEDLQWVDASTVDLISALARGRKRALLMLIGTYRPLDGPSSNPWKAVKQDLVLHRLCEEIELGPISESDVAKYLTGDSAVHPPRGLAALLHRHSEGNPLFMVAALDHMTKKSLIFQSEGSWRLRVPLEQIDPGVPESLRQMIEAQIESLTETEQRVLEVASVAGAIFSPISSAAAAELSTENFEEICDEMSRRSHLVRAVDPPLLGGSSGRLYEFVHALYREVFYRRQSPARRAKLHRQIGLRLEALFPDRLNELAPELAEHFEAASDWASAVRYLGTVAETALRRYAHREAAVVLEHALELLSRLPEEDRSAGEIPILEKLAATYEVLFDPRTIATYEALAASAARKGMIEVEARALIDLALPLASFGSERYLDALERALRLSASQEDPILRTETRATCLVRRMAVIGWNSQDANECRSSIDSPNQTGEPRSMAARLIDRSFLQSLSSRYREAHRSAISSFRLLSAGLEESPYTSVAHWLAHRSLLFMGEWGAALREIEAAIARVEKNGDYHRVHTLRLHRAWVHLFAQDFRGALMICDAVGPSLTSMGTAYGIRLCQVLSGCAEAGLGNVEAARRHLFGVRDGMARERLVFDWYWRIPLESALTDLSLVQQDFAQARQQAERFLRAAQATEERTWQALAWEANGRVAAAQMDTDRARSCIGEALSKLEGFELPIAAWRVHATAAKLDDSCGRTTSASKHRAISGQTIHQLADSLAEDPALKESFLGSSAVSAALREGSIRSHP